MGIRPRNPVAARLIVVASLWTGLWPASYAQSWEEAIQGQQMVIDLFLTDLQESFTFLAEDEQQTYVNRYRYNLDMHRGFCYQFVHRFPELGADAMNLTLATKGMILNTGREMRRTILQSGDTAAIALYAEWTDLKDRIAEQYSMPESKRVLGLPKMEKRAVQYEKDLYRMAAADNGLPDLLAVRWEAVREALPDKHAAVEFSHFRYFDGEGWTDSVIYVAFVLKKDFEWPRMVRLGEEKEFANIMSAGKDLSTTDRIRYLYGFPEPGIDDPEDMAGDRLYALTWKKIEPLLQEGDTIHLAPTGWLHLLNEAAIPTGPEQVLADRFHFKRTQTTSLLAKGAGKEQLGSPEGIALFGGIDYEKKDPVGSAAMAFLPESDFEAGQSRGDSWKYLPGTLAEVQAIEKMAAEKEISTMLYSGQLATEEAFSALSGNAEGSIIHIATHGFFLEDNRVEVAENAFRVAGNPLLRAGLLMAGGGISWRGEPSGDGKDGILTALDIVNSDLGGVPLVVLSACNTGLGTIEAGEGVYGLQRAFRMAGADYLLMTLWEVPDMQTAQFMQLLYDNLLKSGDVSEAFVEARDTLRKRYASPYYWGAFVLTR